MRNWTLGFLVSLLVIGGLVVGCGEQARELQPEILKVVSQTPALNATGVDYKQSLSITFKFPIDIRKFNINDLFASYGSNHTAGTPEVSSATIEASANQKTLTISGIKGWSNLTSGAGPKVVEIVAGAGKIKDIFKNEIHAGSTLWKFTLAGIGGVASVYPADGATGVSTSTQIRATFSDEMDASTIDTSTFTVSGSTVTGAVTYDTDTKTATFTPASRLEAQHTYVATIAASVKDKNGNELGSICTWSFTTADEISPGILSVSPVNAATDVPTNTQVKVNFSGDMDASTISTNTFTLSGSIVTGTVSYNESTKRATFTPDNNLDEYKTYVATIAAGVKDSRGNALGTAYSWSFKTADETAPTAGSLSINSGAASTESKSVTVSLEATDNVGVVAYYLSESSTPPSAGDAGWVIITPTTNYSADVPFALSGCGGTKEVFGWFKDAAENVSNSASDTILSVYVKIWDATYNGGSNDYAYGIAVDGSGNIFVTGASKGANYDYTTIKYDINGNEVWIATYEGGADDRGQGIAVDGSGNVYVTGYSWIGTDYDYTTIKYDTNRNEVWIATYEGGADDRGRGVAVAGSGNVYVTGYSYNGSDYDYTTIKYDSNGNVTWIATYESGNDDLAYGIALDSVGNVYVTGNSSDGSDENYVTVKYDSNGNEVWAATYDGGSDDYANGIAVDGSGNVYVTGSSYDGSDENYVTVKYDSNGNEVWVATYDGGSDDYANGIAVDGSGNVYVTGRDGNSDYYTIKYDSGGNEIWALASGDGSGAFGIAIDDAGNVYVTGNSGALDYYTIKYGQN